MVALPERLPLLFAAYFSPGWLHRCGRLILCEDPDTGSLFYATHLVPALTGRLNALDRDPRMIRVGLTRLFRPTDLDVLPVAS